MKPFFLKSVCKDYIWGGNLLRDYGKTSNKDRIAESWELSCHPDGESIIDSGEFYGMTLTEYLKKYPEALGKNCDRFEKFPVLVKLIDAKENLSIQVHPDNAYAKAHENGQWGKSEFWYVIHAEPGAEIIYGFSQEITKEQYRLAIENHMLLDWVRHVPVHTGDMFYVPAGTVHAIGKGVLMAEIQQNSNLTYRVYDYDRGRELQIEKALDVTNLKPTINIVPGTPVIRPGYAAQYMCKSEFFTVQKVHAHQSTVGYFDSFRHLLILDGSGFLMTEDGKMDIEKGDSIFIPAGGFCPIRGRCKAIKTYISKL